MAKATTTIRQVLNHRPEHGAWFAANQALFNRVAAFYFEVIQAHEKVLGLGNHEAMRALETLTHTTEKNPYPVRYSASRLQRGGRSCRALALAECHILPTYFLYFYLS